MAKTVQQEIVTFFVEEFHRWLQDEKFPIKLYISEEDHAISSIFLSEPYKEIEVKNLNEAREVIKTEATKLLETYTTENQNGKYFVYHCPDDQLISLDETDDETAEDFADESQAFPNQLYFFFD